MSKYNSQFKEYYFKQLNKLFPLMEKENTKADQCLKDKTAIQLVKLELSKTKRFIKRKIGIRYELLDVRNQETFTKKVKGNSQIIPRFFLPKYTKILVMQVLER